uniref:lysophosphatidylserine lipase ABHD12-like isoform X2 n=1 Tax=Styela clava TaxID=7725 RepID=UPI00193A0CA4|nr:lysophosphatidylserine lipase ABHD12-like isoform X2 [Styela clava]
MATIFYECMSGIFSSSCYFVIYGFLVYVTIPLIFKIYPKIVFEGLFLNRVCPPVWLLKLNKPDKAYNLKESKNCYVKSSSGSTLGVWHIPPVTQYDTPEVKLVSLQDAKKIIIYCHGNSFHRGFKHRRDLYSELQKSGFHIIAFDYSGFADSTGQPSPTRVVEDAISMYKWMVKQLQKEDVTIVLWGHSLGTYISTRALSLMYGQKDGTRLPDCLILGAPFTNTYDAADCFPLSKYFYLLYPFMRSQVHKNIRQYDVELRTEKYLPTIKAPVMILHAKDDQRIDIHLGETLYEKTTSDPMTKSPHIRFIRMHKDYGVKHYTAKHPEINQLVHDFMAEVAKVKGDQEQGTPERRCDNRALGSFTRHVHQHEGAIAHVRPERWHSTPRLSDT